MKTLKKNIRDEMIDLFVERQNELIQQADYMKLIAESKEREEKFISNTLVLAANYFTEEKIREISNDSKMYLKKFDINDEDLVNMFSDVSKINIDDVERLAYRESEIIEWKILLNNRSEPFSNEKEYIKQRILHIVDDINGGTSNEC